MRLLSVLALLALGTVSPSLRPAVAQPRDAFEQNARLGRGVNIIGYDPIWRDRGEARFRDEYFAMIRGAGLQTVRVNLHPFRHMDSTDGYRLRTAWLETLDWAVEGALAAGLMVILDLHEFNAMADDPEGKKEMFLSFWRQVAPRYADAPDAVVFELLNEPNRKVTNTMWNGLLREALAIVRNSNPTRTVIVGPGEWNSIRALKDLDLPEDDRNLIVTVHYYTPMEFTHQGARWTPEFVDRTGVEWLGTEADLARIRTDFAIADAWAKAHDRPVLLGEFGAYDKGPMESRARYTAAVARSAESLGWSWAYWQFDSDFILYDVAGGRWVQPILEALVPTGR